MTALTADILLIPLTGIGNVSLALSVIEINWATMTLPMLVLD